MSTAKIAVCKQACKYAEHILRSFNNSDLGNDTDTSSALQEGYVNCVTLRPRPNWAGTEGFVETVDRLGMYLEPLGR